jgi:acyl carrier protein
MDIRETVISTCRTVANEQERKLAILTDGLLLLESGLDSLCLAVIVARLEDTLGFDPFDSEDDIDLPVTVGDLIRLYQNAARTAR